MTKQITWRVLIASCGLLVASCSSENDGDDSTDPDAGGDTDTDTDGDADTDADGDTDTDTDGDTDADSDGDISVPGDFHYKVDQFGYHPDEPKVAVISRAVEGQFSPDDFEPGATLEVRTWPADEVVFSGSPEVWNSDAIDPLCGDMGFWFDFSEVTAPGRYAIYDVERDLYSHVFNVREDVYRVVLIHAMRTFFYQREAFAKATPYADARWIDGASFMNDRNARYVFEPDNDSLERDVSGGWMDAGDTNKYMTNLNETIHVLLMAYQIRPAVWREDLGIPESGNGVPDILDEINYEIEWMKRMQDADGGVFIKSGDNELHEASPPSSHDFPRYYGMKCSSSTISFAAILAHSAYVFAEIEGLAAQAAEITPMAEAAWDHYHANERNDNCDNGEILAGDADRTLEQQDMIAANAAMWLWALTGDETYHDYFKEHYTAFEAIATDWWGPYMEEDQDAALFYTTLLGADSEVVSDILASAKSGAQNAQFFGFVPNGNLYRSAMPTQTFHWGSNKQRAKIGSLNTNAIEYGLDASSNSGYRQRALETLHWLHGVNPHGKVMLSNMAEQGAENSVNEFYHSWFCDGSEWDSLLEKPFVGPPPGFLVGGPNASYTGDLAPPAGEPPAKSYIDFNNGWPDNSWEVTENSITYQAAYIRLLSYFVPRSKAPESLDRSQKTLLNIGSRE